MTISTKFTKMLSTYSKGVENFFQEKASQEDIESFKRYFCIDKLDSNLEDFITHCVGENDVVGGLVAGNSLLSITEMIKNNKLSLSVEYDIVSYNEDCIKEGSFNKKWAPFADGADGYYFCFDFDPAKSGTMGQVIAIDIDSNTGYVIAPTLDEFINWLEKHHKNSNINYHVDEDEKYFEWKSGSVFNDTTIFMSVDDSCETVEISESFINAANKIDGYFSTPFESKTGQIQISELSKVKGISLDLQDDLDFSIIKYMENLSVVHFSIHKSQPMPDLQNHKKLKSIFFNYVIGDEELKWVKELKQIKMLAIRNSDITDISILENANNIKELEIAHLPLFEGKGLEKLVQLTVLSVEKVPNLKSSYLESLINMKKLEFNDFDDYRLDNLACLKTMKKLTHFQTNQAKDESDIEAIKELKGLKELYYTVPNVAFMKNSKKLTHISVDVRTTFDYELLADFPIISIYFYNMPIKNDLNIDKIETLRKSCEENARKYCPKLQAYSFRHLKEDK